MSRVTQKQYLTQPGQARDSSLGEETLIGMSLVRQEEAF